MTKHGVLFLGGAAATLAAGLLVARNGPAGSGTPIPAPRRPAVVAAAAPVSRPTIASSPVAASRGSSARRASLKSPKALPTPVEVEAQAGITDTGDSCSPSIASIREHMEDTTRTDIKREGDKWAEWFYGQRAYPAQTIPADAMGKAYKAALAHNNKGGNGKNGASSTTAVHGSAAAREGITSLTSSGSWTPIGPTQIPGGQTDTTVGPRTTVSGRVSAIAVDPTNSDVVYAGGAQGGVWKSTDATSASPHWTPLTDSQPSLAVGAIAIDPADTNIVYVGTGEANGSCDSYYGQGILRSADGGATWTQLAGNTGGPFAGQSISKIVIDPATAGTTGATTLWASTALGFLSSGTEQCALATGIYNGAAWRSTDSGNTWTRMDVPTGIGTGPGARIHDMVLDPVDDNVLYVTVRAAPTPANGGVWRTNNARDAHPKFTLVTSGFANSTLAVPGLRRINIGIANQTTDPLNRTLYAAIEGATGSALWGFYKTTSGGANWSHVDAGNNGNGKIVGTTLTRSNGPSFTSAWVGKRIILGNYVSARVSSVTDASTMKVSVNFGNTKPITIGWSVAAYPDYCGGQCFYDMTIGVDPHDPTGNTVYVGGNPHSFATDLNDSHHRSHYVWVSTDGGNTWGSVSQGSAATGGLHSDDHAIVFDPNTAGRVYDGNDGGIWRSDDGGATWADLNTDALSITQFQSVALHPSDTSKVLGGTQDNGTDLHDAATGVSAPQFFHSDDGDGGQSLFDQDFPGMALHTYFNQTPGLIGPATDFSFSGGEAGPSAWFFAGGYLGYGAKYQNGFDPADRMSFYVPMRNNPGVHLNCPLGVTTNPVYVGSNKLYRSPFPLPWYYNAYYGYPPAWTSVSPDLTHGSSTGGFLSAIAPFPALIGGKEVIYTGASDGRIEVSTTVDPACAPPGPCIATWSVIDDPAILPNRFVSEMEADASDATGNTAYATFSGFNVNTPTRPGHVFKTTNGLSGTPTWTDITGDLPDVPANCIALDPTTGTIYLGTDIGVFESSNGGVNWVYDSDSFPTVAVFGLDRNPNTGQIVASTHGRGMFELTPAGP
jgi:hypothetical protein